MSMKISNIKKTSSTSDRLKQVLSDRKIKQVDILDMAKPYCQKYGVKLGKNDLSQYISGKVAPGQEKLSILSMALGVSELWLMGYSDVDDCEHGSLTARFLSLVYKLDNESIQEMINFANFKLQQKDFQYDISNTASFLHDSGDGDEVEKKDLELEKT